VNTLWFHELIGSRKLLAAMFFAALLVLGVLRAPAAHAAEPDTASVRRFALLVGANDGGSERELLRYASSDAEMFGKALTELGGLDKDDRVLLGEPDVASLEQGFADVAAKIRKAQTAGERVQFVFYYSGHSDETGLLLGGVRVDYKRLRGLIDKVPADVRIAILDSCSSGAFTRYKGGKKREPFLAGAAAEVEGHAYLTSSSADEAAQESDRIGGSFFTHFLVTGLRGAADADSDRRVTLDEAYRFAFDETLARTETTSGGPQHAAYDISLAGTGDLVMTDLRKTSAKLEIAAEVFGRIYVRDRRGNLAAELFKPKGSGVVTLALEPGDYAVTIDDGRNLHRADVAVRSNKTELLADASLDGIAIEGTRLRGSDSPRQIGDRPPPPPGGYTRVPFNIGAGPGAEINTRYRGRILNNTSLSLGGTGGAAVQGMQLAIGGVWARDYVVGIQAAIGVSISRGPLTGLQSAVISLGHERVAGLQMGFGVGYAKHLRGVQLGAVNVAGDVAGVQAGLVSITRGRAKGLQLGLVTYAEEADAAIALIPYSKKGGVWFDVWTSDVQLIHAALKFRARRTYTFLTAGVHPLGSDGNRSFSGGLGIGGPLVWRPHFSVELDNAISALNAGYTVTRAPYLIDTLRLSLAWRPYRHFAIFGAVTGNVLLDFAATSDDYQPGYAWANNIGDPAQTGLGLKIWPGFAAGFQF
jgi:Caspase domain